MNQQIIDSYELEGYINRPMSTKDIAQMLDQHGIDRSWVDGELYAGTSNGDIDEITKTTDWDLFTMLDYLNY